MEDLTIYLGNDIADSEWELWSGDWPSTKHPHNTYVFTLNNVKDWWKVDFCTHPFTSNFAHWLCHSRTVLMWGLPQLPGLLMDAQVVQNNQQYISIFKEDLEVEIEGCPLVPLE